MVEKYVFSMWVYNDISEFEPDEMKIWAECGMTHPMSPQVSPKKYEPSVLIPWLDKAEELGMKLILSYGGITFYDYMTLGKEEFIKNCKKLYDALGSHPGLGGVCIGDEPCDPKSLEATVETMKIHKELAPHLIPLINYPGGISIRGKETFTEYEDLAGYLKHVEDASGVGIICFDIYDQTINDGGGKTIFFNEVKKFVEAGKEAKLDVIGCLLSSGGHVYKAQTEVDIRWQIHMAAVLGLRGALWFRFYDRDFAIDAYGSPVDEFGNRTEAYYGMLRTQRRFQNHYGDIMLKLSHQKTYSVTLDRGVFPIFSPGDHEAIKNITADDEAIVSFYKDADGGEYLAICNSEWRHYGVVRISYDREKYSLYNLTMNGKTRTSILDLDDNGPDVPFGVITMIPAGFMLLKIEKK